MSDQRLRELDRPGVVASFSDRVHRLNARLRAGRVARDRVELAAWCSSETALAVLGQEPPPMGEDWWTGLRRFGGEVCARATAHVLLAVRLRERGPLWPFFVDEREVLRSHALGASVLAWCDSKLSHLRRNEALENGLQKACADHGWPDELVGGLLGQIHSPASLPPRGLAWDQFWMWAVRRVHRLDEAAGPPLREWALGADA